MGAVVNAILTNLTSVQNGDEIRTEIVKLFLEHKRSNRSSSAALPKNSQSSVPERPKPILYATKS